MTLEQAVKILNSDRYRTMWETCQRVIRGDARAMLFMPVQARGCRLDGVPSWRASPACRGDEETTSDPRRCARPQATTRVAMTAREAVSFSARLAEVTQDTAARVAHQCGVLPRFMAWRVVMANHALLLSVAALVGA